MTSKRTIIRVDEMYMLLFFGHKIIVEKNKSLARQARAIGVVLHVIKNHNTDVNVCRKGLHALSNITDDGKNIKQSKISFIIHCGYFYKYNRR